MPNSEPSIVPLVAPDPPEHWAKYNSGYWLEHYEDFLWFFFGQCFPEPRSTKPIEEGAREALVTGDYNAETIEHIARYPRLRDRAVFVGNVGRPHHR